MNSQISGRDGYAVVWSTRTAQAVEAQVQRSKISELPQTSRNWACKKQIDDDVWSVLSHDGDSLAKSYETGGNGK